MTKMQNGKGLLDRRASGVLMHISSLPGKTGIGTFGREARSFVDFLKNTSQTYWQILPVGPTGMGDSPYQSFSTFAGNPYFIDFELLEKDGLLSGDDWRNVDWGSDMSSVDYGLLYRERGRVFEKIQRRFGEREPADYKKFCAENSWWLDDYSLFMAVKDAHGGRPFCEWEDGIRRRVPEAMEEWGKRCADRVSYHKILQYLFRRQWTDLKRYANGSGIRIIGDIPIYVAADSSDVWSSPEQFMLDGDYNPVEVAGCPPDGFSADGQLWGNPVYNWADMEKDGYSWWKRRLAISLEIYDVLRIDHFRGFDSYYCIPFGSKDARGGTWRNGPGASLFAEIRREFGDLPIIAEDLGFLTDSVRNMLSEVGFPGMKVLQFAFDSRETNTGYQPHSYPRNSVVYTGTHDNDTILGWIGSVDEGDIRLAMRYLRSGREDLPKNMMAAAMASVSNTCVLTMQDLLGLGGGARMNRPSTLGGNWKWRALPGQISGREEELLRDMTELYERSRK